MPFEKIPQEPKKEEQEDPSVEKARESLKRFISDLKNEVLLVKAGWQNVQDPYFVEVLERDQEKVFQEMCDRIDTYFDDPSLAQEKEYANVKYIDAKETLNPLNIKIEWQQDTEQHPDTEYSRFEPDSTIHRDIYANLDEYRESVLINGEVVMRREQDDQCFVREEPVSLDTYKKLKQELGQLTAEKKKEAKVNEQLSKLVLEHLKQGYLKLIEKVGDLPIYSYAGPNDLDVRTSFDLITSLKELNIIASDMTPDELGRQLGLGTEFDFAKITEDMNILRGQGAAFYKIKKLEALRQE